MPKGDRSVGKVDTLPIWAQQNIEFLKRRVRDLESQIAAATDHPESRVSSHNRPGENRRYLPDDEIYRFQLGGSHARDFIQVRLKNSSVGRLLEIHAGDTVKVIPGASNTIYVDLETREGILKAAEGS